VITYYQTRLKTLEKKEMPGIKLNLKRKVSQGLITIITRKLNIT
jgi:hypothetical protein